MARHRHHGPRGRRRGGGGPRRPRPVLTGTLRVARPGVASVETPEGSFPVARGGIREGMNGDEVQVSVVTRGRGGERLAVVRSVLARATSTFLGSFAWAEPLGVVVPLDARLSRDFFVLPEDGSPARLGVGEGDVVVARILSYPARGQAGVVTLERRVGASGELDFDMEGVIASFGLVTEFSEAALAEAQACRADVPAALGEVANDAGAEPRDGARLSSRLDLRDACTLTVDPADARDFDDAVSARRLAGGGFAVGVHIADVTHYLRWDSSLDLEARARGCSVYLADRVLPMLPERLSNDVCSLRPHEERLCVSVLMELDARGRVVAAEAARTAIRSRARLSYDEVDALLAARRGGVPGADPDGQPAHAAQRPAVEHEPVSPAAPASVPTPGTAGAGWPVPGEAMIDSFRSPCARTGMLKSRQHARNTSGSAAVPRPAPTTGAGPAGRAAQGAPGIDPAVAEALAVLDEVARLREGLRRERGAVDFSTREAKVVLDADGTPIDVRVRTKTPATSLIEEAMLMANEAVAGMLDEAGAPAAYRVHERPAPDDLAAAARVLRALDVVGAGEIDALVAGEPRALVAVLERTVGTRDEYVANALLLRAQRRAVYESRNGGHYALGARAYCHFTSPIRRYPDVIVHRALKALMDAAPDGRARIGTLPAVPARLPRGQIDALPQLCCSCSEQERTADAATRSSQKVKMAQLYAGRVGERAVGIVSGVERFGLFVMLEESCAEGLVPTRSLGEEWFSLDEAGSALVGEASGCAWRLGQRVVVEVVGATPARGQIDFRLVG